MGVFSLFGQQPPKMKAISYRGGVVEFRIPASWKEDYSDVDGGTFYEEKPNSGTLRLKIITLETPSEVTSNSAVQLLGSLKQFQGKYDHLPSGNALFKYEQPSVDQGMKIKIVYWIIANPIPPNHARIVTFSYTILKSQGQNSQTMQEIGMLDSEIRASKFATILGN